MNVNEGMEGVIGGRPKGDRGPVPNATGGNGPGRVIGPGWGPAPLDVVFPAEPGTCDDGGAGAAFAVVGDEGGHPLPW